MLSFEDTRWAELRAGYRVPVDLRPLLRSLESADEPGPIWERLWQELYHQGDVGEGSFITLPHLVRIYRARGKADWNIYALSAVIELSRAVRGNPDVPERDRDSYEQAFRDLAALGLAELPQASDRELVRSILAVLAIAHGARAYGRIIIELTEDELLELQEQALEHPEEAG